MRNLLLAGVAAFSVVALPVAAAAQTNSNPDSVPGSTNSMNDKRSHTMTAEQKADYDSWDDVRRSDYDTWPYDSVVYYWGLEPMYQTGYWALTPEQRGKILAMSEAQREAAWQSIMAQINGTTATTTPASSSGTVTTYADNATVQPVNAPTTTDYPICKGDIQDSCINPREAGKNWGNRPLDHWPGKPASEM